MKLGPRFLTIAAVLCLAGAAAPGGPAALESNPTATDGADLDFFTALGITPTQENSKSFNDFASLNKTLKPGHLLSGPEGTASAQASISAPRPASPRASRRRW